jgi:lysozyme family protein
MCKFDEAFKIVVANEGGYVNDKNDIGGETKYGISKRAYPQLDIQNLTIEKAKEIYKQNYWNKCRCDDIKSDKLATQVFDIAVNCGVRAAGLMLQRAINMTSKVKTNVDGIIGLKTLANVNVSDARVLNNNVVMTRINYYQDIVKRNPLQGRFLNGWINRARRFLIN